MTNQPRYRVAQWGTGCTGSAALKAILNHPRLDLVAVKVYDRAKCGLDAGDLCGRHATGVIVTDSIAEIIAHRPDCVVYMPDRAAVADMCELLGNGINLVTSVLGFNHRGSLSEETRSQIETACQIGNATLYATGSSPGWLSEILPFALTVTQTKLNCITITDYSDMSQSSFSASMLFDHIHFGADPNSLDPNEPIGTAVSTPPTLRMMAEALGIAIDDVKFRRDFGLARNDVALGAGVVNAGTIGAIRMEVVGLNQGRAAIVRRTIWHVTHDIDVEWTLREDGIHYRVEGDVPLDVMIQMPVSEADRSNVQGAVTANPVVNAIPYVCAAARGLRHTSELPTVLAQFG